MNEISLFKLFLIFTKIGAILLGGGYVILPILTNEFVEKKKLIEYDDLMNYFALSQSLPGIIAANISMFIGYKLHGKTGALVAMLGVIFVPFWTIIILATVINYLSQSSYIEGALWGIGIAVIALITLTFREMWQKSSKDKFFYTIFIASLLSLVLLKFSPIKTIIIFSIIGVIFKKLTIPKEAR